MPNIYRSTKVTGEETPPYPNMAGEVVTVRGSVTLPASVGANDRVELVILPHGCQFVDAILDSDDLDSGGSAAIVIDVGFMSGDPGAPDATRTVGSEFLAASNVAQAGGVVRPTAVGAFRTGVSENDRSIGALIKTAPATSQAGTIGLTLLYRSP